jgi:uncharacterized protein YraI
MFVRNMLLLVVGTVVAGLLLPAQAMAQYGAYTRADLNLRVGPGTNYGVIDVIPRGHPVDVLGCLADYNWCDIEWDGLRGWVSASYLVQPGTQAYLPQVGPRIGLPIITFSFGTYHDRYYRDRPWYRERTGRWQGRRDGRSERRGQREETDRRDRREEAERSGPREETERRERRQEAEQAPAGQRGGDDRRRRDGGQQERQQDRGH